MSDYFSETEIKVPFETLQRNNIRYLLLRNIDDELPDNLRHSKDIDILVHPSFAPSAHQALKMSGWSQIRHPWDFGNNFIFLYSMIPFRMYNKDGLHIDVAYHLACRSPNQGEWTPLDKKIQDLAWSNRREVPNSIWRYQLSHEDEAIHLLTRCIFDKKKFSGGYIRRLDKLLSALDVETFRIRLEVVFFKFTPVLESLLYSRQYEVIRQQYLQFSDY